ncbi:MAG: hypothetical protein JOZ43_05935 [Acidobacteriales bacterium]|nr:hypothetical protein [Terriglobales bacterium]
MTTDQAIAAADQSRRDGRQCDARGDLASHLAHLPADSLERARTLCSLAQLDRDLHDITASLQNYFEAVRILRIYSEPLLLAYALRHLADVQRESAEADIREAIAILSTHPDAKQLDLANAFRILALLTSDPATWRGARDLYSKLGIDAGIGECDRRLSQQERATPQQP